MRDYSRAAYDEQRGLTVLSERFGDPIDHQTLCAHMATDLAPFVVDASVLKNAIELGTHISEYAHFLRIRENEEQSVAFNELCRL